MGAMPGHVLIATVDPTKQPPQGMEWTPDVLLFIGGLVLTVAVVAVVGVFLARALRAERIADTQRGKGGA
ncbi:MAG: hypothetical protein JNK53_07180 [Phycisphaerae bacterium]|nr:hypothetical protein [Phycisphaerae bacterium]